MSQGDDHTVGKGDILGQIGKANERIKTALSRINDIQAEIMEILPQSGIGGIHCSMDSFGHISTLVIDQDVISEISVNDLQEGITIAIRQAAALRPPLELGDIRRLVEESGFRNLTSEILSKNISVSDPLWDRSRSVAVILRGGIPHAVVLEPKWTSANRSARLAERVREVVNECVDQERTNNG